MKVIEYEIINHGYEHSDYFQGCGTYGSPFKHVVTGVGNNAKDAYEDAVEQIAMTEDAGVLPTRPKGIRKRDKVPARISKHEASNVWWRVSIRYNVAKHLNW